MTILNGSESLLLPSRRRFLKKTGALLAATASSPAADLLASNESPALAYVGTYATGEDGARRGEGIYLFDVDLAAGRLLNRRLAAKTTNPSWIAIHPSRKYLYAINEVSVLTGKNGSVSAFAIDGATGGLTLLNKVSSAGAGPAYMSLDARGRFAFVANYYGGSFVVLPIHEDGRLGDAVDMHRDRGSVGAATPAHLPLGSFANGGHDAPHAHMIASDPSNRWVIANDLGQDRLYVYRFDEKTGKLTPNGAPVSLPSGDGPRHFAFHPNGRWLYVIEEDASMLAFLRFDPETGTLSTEQTLSALPPNFAGTTYGSEIAVSPNGRFVLSANRLHDTISICAIADDGRLSLIGEVPTMGDYPRHFAFDPGGNFVFACDQRSDCITSFRMDRATGNLTFTGEYAALGSPAMIAFVS
jgi:6-phosphogluconolactonase